MNIIKPCCANSKSPMSDTNSKKSFPKVPDEAIVKDEKPLETRKQV
jgi:hypothetical protein